MTSSPDTSERASRHRAVRSEASPRRRAKPGGTTLRKDLGGRRTQEAAKPQKARTPLSARRALALPAVLAVIGLGAAIAWSSPPAAVEAAPPVSQREHAVQSFAVRGATGDTTVVRDSYTATTGAQTLIAGGTNYDWARLVMTLAGWPTSDSNITVFTRWMRQENGVDDWWNRNNPLNNGWGSGGGSGLGSYDNLVIAAENCADALHRNSGYAAIAAGFAASAPTDQIEAAIWASPWASSHYANGGHWAYTPATVVEAPPSAW